MIEKTSAFKVGDQPFLTLDMAQKHEIVLLLDGDPQITSLDKKEIADWILENKTHILDILTTTVNSKPKARKINGGRKNRKSSGNAVVPAASTPEPFNESQ